MEASKTASTCTLKTAQATHVFDILDYSKHRGMGNDKFIRSGVFSVGGHNWAILFYPDGFSKEKHQKNDYISIYLVLLCEVGKVRASCDLRLVDRSTGSSSSVQKTELRYFDATDGSRFAPQTANFQDRSKIEAYVQDDRLTIECIVTVVKEPQVTKTKSFPRIEVPPSDISEHFGKLLDEGEGFDVSFCVGREVFAAHRAVLAARSPVFRAELFGPMREAKTLQQQQHITIKDMQPDVFRALLHFIYADSLASCLDVEGDKNTEMIRHLLVAADRYAMDRLKLLCQSILCENLNVGTVATTLALADQHNCDRLKEACLEFITCSNSMDAVVATQGYKNLKRTCPSVIVDAMEKAVKSLKA